jgi:hypothetical protein
LSVAIQGDGNGTVASTPSGINCAPQCVANFGSGSMVTLQPTAAPNSVFVGWNGGGCSGTDSCVITLNADTNVGANFEAAFILVEVGLLGSGEGSVSSDIFGIACPDDCDEAFARTDTVTLTASPALGNLFAGWSGDCSGFGTGDCTLDVAFGPYQAYAQFEAERTLTVRVTGSGSVTSTPNGINCPGDCVEGYAPNTSVTLVAAAQPGHVFSGWSGACTGKGNCVVLMSAARNVMATFSPTGTEALILTLTGSGNVISTPTGIDCPDDCSENYAAGTEVTLTATPSGGFAFTGWSGSCTGTSTCVVTMSATRNVGATFSLIGGIEIFASGFEN